VKEKLAVDLDSEIATTSLRISLMCPVWNLAPDYCTCVQRYNM